MKIYLHCWVILFGSFPLPGHSQGSSDPTQITPQILPTPPKFIFQETRRSNRRDLEISVSVDLASVGDVSAAAFIPVKFAVKNVSTGEIGILRVNTNYDQSVEICLADKFNDPNDLFPLSRAGGGSLKLFAPGQSIEFNIQVPIALFKMKGKRFIAGIRYQTQINGGIFRGEAFSKPFLLPSVD